MVRVIIKGGVWKNTEDEILKAAISKYGKNQWARISSLLVRKTPKQCKARWYEWLDPSIKKTEWSKEEDEKLLHLAKLMPTQWRTIAPVVGRTANQCLERYQKLLDEAEARENQEAGGSTLGLTGTGENAPSADDVRRLRPGEIDPNPETKPARPDPIDMDEDEKEMLSEARARLANTQGKKAKRKARERALEEARRLAMLQKRRELKAAGIEMKAKPKKKGIDYNIDIPFERKPAPGFYDTSEEASRSYKAPVGKTMRALENRNAAEEDAAKKKRQREGGDKPKDAKAAALSKNEDQIRKLKEAEQISKRRKLDLPQHSLGLDAGDDVSTVGGQTPLTNRSYRDPSRSQLRSSLMSLPAPKNDFNIVLDDDEAHAGESEQLEQPLTAEDASERDARLARAAEEERKRALARRSQVVQRGLPRPKNVDLADLLQRFDATNLSNARGPAAVQSLVQEEMVRLIHHDSIEYPLPGSQQAGSTRSRLPPLSDDSLQRARELMHRELASCLGFPGASADVLKRLTAAALDDDEETSAKFDTALRNIELESAWSADHGGWVDRSGLRPRDVVRGQAALLEVRRQDMSESATLAAKGERTLAKLLGGYQARSKTLASKIKESFDALAEASISTSTFERMHQEERGAVLERLDKMRKEVASLERQDGISQRRYKELDEERRRLREECESLQAEIDMRAAEAINDAALGDVESAAESEGEATTAAAD